MGKSIVIIMLGFTTSFVMLGREKSRHAYESVALSAGNFSTMSTANASASAVNMALNRLYFDETWRAGYSNLLLNGDTVTVVIDDATSDATVDPGHVRIVAMGEHHEYFEATEAIVFTSDIAAFAVWSMDSLRNVRTQDDSGTPDASLKVEYASFMPEVNGAAFVSEASNQGHLISGSGHFHPGDGYPNGSFYYGGTTPNVIAIQGDLHVRDYETIYGIYGVAGDIILDRGAEVKGVLYQPYAGKSIRNADGSDTKVFGGIVTRNPVDGISSDIIVRHQPDYLNKFINTYAPTEPGMRILSWK